MNIDFLLKYKKEDSSFTSVPLELNNEIKLNNLFKCLIDCQSINQSANYSLNLKLLKETFVEADLIATINFTNEEVLTVSSIFPEFNFKSFIPDQFLIETNSRKLIFNCKKAYPVDFSYTQKSVTIRIIIDAPYLHPAWDYSKGQRFSTAAPILPKEEKYQLSFDIYEFQMHQKIAFIKKSPYPFGYKSAFILTDHCDFDTTEKLKTFLYGNNNNGWLNRGLKITKGVFALDAKEGEEKKSDSLENEPYKKLIDELHTDGSEIVHHALKHSGQLTKEEFNTTFDNFAKTYQPQTWIDHGSYLKYCYSQGAKEHPDYLLIKKMQEHGYNNLWSFDDVNIDANQTLNILTTQKSLPIELIKEIFKKIFEGKFLIAGHYFRTIFHRNYSKNIVVDFVMYFLASTKSIFINLQKRKGTFIKDCINFSKKIFKFNQFRNKEIVPYENTEVLKYAQPLYLETRKPFTQYTLGDILMFYTFETTHLVDIYNKKSLDKLVQENGTHIGHTYILNDLPYINSIFKKVNNQYTLAEKWIEFLDALQEKIKTKEVWNPNMGEYATYNIALQNILVEYTSEGSCLIKNNNDKNIDGFVFMGYKNSTYLLNSNSIEPLFYKDSYSLYKLTLAANSSYLISCK